MRPLGTVFDGSTSLIETQRVLCTTCNLADTVRTGSSRPSTFYPGTAFCSLGICCAYIAGMLDKYCLEDDSCNCHLYVVKSTSTIFGPLLKQNRKIYFRFIRLSIPERPCNIIQPTTLRMRV